VNNFLIVRLGSLGDIIHAIPVAAALRHEFPHAQIDWMVDPAYEEFLGLVTCINRRIPVNPRAFRRGPERRQLKATVRSLRQVGYDVVLDLQGLLKSAVLARSVRGRQTIGFPRRHLREPLARFFYTATPDPGDATHVIHKNLALLAPLQVQDRKLRFPLAIPRTPTVESVLERYGAGGYVLLNPGAAWPNKRWPAARFGAVAAALRDEFGLKSLILWGPGERDLAFQAVETSLGAAEMAPPTTLVDLVGLSRGAQLSVSGDTGPLHIAGAVGTPQVALFGPTRAERNGPWGLYDATISRVEQCECVYKRRCRRAVPCIDDIGIEEVVAAARHRLTARA
jgi:lipopolysaccharide heptosyltransferase I